jgi:hypothetical protein
MPPRGYWGVKCHTGVLGRQMPPEGIGASNATPNLLGRQRPPRGYWGVKGHESLMASKIRGVKGPSMGRGRKGH